jgi:hypothetical protein
VVGALAAVVSAVAAVLALALADLGTAQPFPFARVHTDLRRPRHSQPFFDGRV